MWRAQAQAWIIRTPRATKSESQCRSWHRLEAGKDKPKILMYGMDTAEHCHALAQTRCVEVFLNAFAADARLPGSEKLPVRGSVKPPDVNALATALQVRRYPSFKGFRLVPLRLYP